MYWNRTNNNGNVAGTSGSRRCNGNGNGNNVAGETGRRNCRCDCHWINDNVAGDASRIALRGPGCISGTGQCGRYTEDFVESEVGFDEGFCGQVSPYGNTQVESENFRRNHCDCRCFNRCFRELLEELLEDTGGCPR